MGWAGLSKGDSFDTQDLNKYGCFGSFRTSLRARPRNDMSSGSTEQSSRLFLRRTKRSRRTTAQVRLSREHLQPMVVAAVSGHQKASESVLYSFRTFVGIWKLGYWINWEHLLFTVDPTSTFIPQQPSYAATLPDPCRLQSTTSIISRERLPKKVMKSSVWRLKGTPNGTTSW